MILGREDVARRPAHVCPKLHKRFDQHSRLNGHVQRSNDPRTLQWFLVAVLFAQGHQARHFCFGNIKFFAAKGG